MGRRSHEPRDRDRPDPRPGRAPNKGRCFDCHTPTRHPELCWPCIERLAGEGR